MSLTDKNGEDRSLHDDGDDDNDKSEPARETSTLDHHTYETCTGRTTDRRLIILSVQIFVTVCILFLCIYKLVINEQSEIYIGLISTLIGIYLPSPLTGQHYD
jgi:hypothetical protein